MASHRPDSPLRSRCFAAASFGLLLLPGLADLGVFGRLPRPPEERRPPAPWPGPPASLQALERWPRRFEEAYDDRFAARGALLEAQAWLWVRGLGVSPTPRVHIGRDGWLFYEDVHVRGRQGLAPPFSPAEQARWVTELRRRRDWAAARGARYLLVPVPGKSLVHPEALPLFLRSAPGGAARYEQVLAAAAAAGVPALDLRPVLRAARREGDVFLRTDWHWNARGAEAGLRALRAFLAAARGVGAPPERPPARLRPRNGPAAHLAEFLGARKLFTETWVDREAPAPRVHPLEAPVLSTGGAGFHAHFRSSRPEATGRVVFLHDSFLFEIREALAEDFEEALFLTTRSFLFPRPVLAATRPDLVVQILWSHHLLTQAPGAR